MKATAPLQTLKISERQNGQPTDYIKRNYKNTLNPREGTQTQGNRSKGWMGQVKSIRPRVDLNPPVLASMKNGLDVPKKAEMIY